MAKDDIDKCTKAYRDSAAFKRASFHTPDEIWNMFVDAEGFTDVVFTFNALVDALSIDTDENGEPLHGIRFYETLRSKLTSWKCQSLWDLLNARLKCKEYKHENDYVGRNLKCLIIGAGPIGLRTAVEMLLLGCKTIVVEKRKEFTRNNVLHLWPFLMTDFRQLGAKKFYGKFGAGSIDHINIKTLQTVMLKVALVFGVEVHHGVEFVNIAEPTDEQGWRVHVHPENYENISKQDFDIIIGADGKKNVLPGFTQIEMRGALAIGITCNFINNNTPEEKNCKEISGISYQFKPAFFDALRDKHGVELENIVYYKDETHYFVMTARKCSLLEQNVFKKDYGDPALLVQSSNINMNKLVDYTCNAVYYSTTLPKVEFKKLANGKPDVALFDFTSLKKADSASRIIERKKRKLLIALVGDSLIEPFWPTGSGCGRGVHSALDVAWMVRLFAMDYPPLAILRERENIYKLLSASTGDNLQKNYNLYTIDPKTRYSSLDTKTVLNLASLKSLYDTDDLESADLTVSSPVTKQRRLVLKKTAVDRKKSGSGTTPTRPTGRVTASKTKRKLERQESKKNEEGKQRMSRNEDEKQKLSICDKKKFFEDHHQKMGSGAPKPKRTPLSSDQFSGLEGIDEDVRESDDDVLVDEQPLPKKKAPIHKSGSLKGQGSREDMKRHGSKENIRTTKKGSLKRHGSKESLRRQSASDGKTKSLKRQSSTDDGDVIPAGSIDDNTTGKRKVFQAKGGGLKAKKNESKKSLEKADTISKPKRRSTSDKKTARRKSRRSESAPEESNAEGADSPREQSVSVEPEPVDAKTWFKKRMEWLLPKLFTETSNTPPETFEHPKEVCLQVAVVPILALALLYNCNKPAVRSKTTEQRLKELIANTNNSSNVQPLRTSIVKPDTSQELSFIKAGSVKDSMQKWQKMLQKEEPTHNFYEFIRKNKKDSGVSCADSSDGILLVKHEHADFTPKDVIDVETQLLADEEEERKRSPLAKMTSGNLPSNAEVQLRLTLEQLCDQTTLINAILMLQVLYNIHKRILDEPHVDKHYRVYTKGAVFAKYVWKWEGAKRYFQDTGWTLCGDFLVLSKSKPLDLVVKVIEDVFRRNRRLQLSNSGSIGSQIEIIEREEAELRAAIEEDGVLATQQQEVPFSCKEIDVATENDSSMPAESDSCIASSMPAGDSTIGSGIFDVINDDLDVKPTSQRNKLQRVESKEHNVGDEDYIVVDFVNEGSYDVGIPMATIEEGNEKCSTSSDEKPEEVEDNNRISMFVQISGDEAVGMDNTRISTNSDIVEITGDEHIEVSEVRLRNASPFATLTRSYKEEEESDNSAKDDGEFTFVYGEGEEGKEDENVFTVAHITVNNATRDDKIKGLKRQDVIETDIVMEDIKTEDDLIFIESKDDDKKSKPKKKNVFSAGKGLKNSTKPSDVSPPVETNVSVDVEACVTSPPASGEFDRSSPIRSSPKNINSSTSNENTVTSPGSIVMQNKQLFDQQIANNLKTRYTTPPEILKPRLESVASTDASAVENNSRNDNIKEGDVTSPERKVSARVSGAMSVFERGEGLAPRRNSHQRNNDIKEEESIEITNNVKPAVDSHTTIAVDSHAKPANDLHVKPADDSHVKPADDLHVKPADDLHVKPADDLHVKPADDSGMAELYESIVTKSNSAKTGSHKKKKNPFKKKGKSAKTEKNNEVSDVTLSIDSITLPNESFENSVGEITSLIDTSADVSLSTDLTAQNVHSEVDLSATFKVEAESPPFKEVPASPSPVNENTSDISAETQGDESGEIPRTQSLSDEAHCNEDDNAFRSSSFTVNRNSKKRPRLSKKRAANTLVGDEEEMLTQTVITDVSVSDISFNSLSEIEVDEEIVSEVKNKDVVEVHVDPSVFTNENGLNDSMQVHVDTSTNSPRTDVVKPVVDIDSLNNGGDVIDDVNSTPTICVTQPALNGSSTEVVEVDVHVNGGSEQDDLTIVTDSVSIPSASSETGLAFYEDDNDASMDVSADMDASVGDESNKKKKKKFPFRISLGKNKEKRKKSKSTSVENLSAKDAHSDSSFAPKTKKKTKSNEHPESEGQKKSSSSAERVPSMSSLLSITPKMKKKSKSNDQSESEGHTKSSDRAPSMSSLLSITPKMKKKSKSNKHPETGGHKLSSSSAEHMPSTSSLSSIPSPTADLDIDADVYEGPHKEKVKSKKLNFFKKKKQPGSTTTTPKAHSFSYKQSENELSVNGALSSKSVSTPASPVPSTHVKTNGHTNHEEVSETVGDRLI